MECIYNKPDKFNFKKLGIIKEIKKKIKITLFKKID